MAFAPGAPFEQAAPDASGNGLRLSVLVPSYRRAADLERCLAALSGQSLKPHQILVVARAEDSETLDVAGRWRERLGLEVVDVTQPGQVHALNAGLAACTGDVVAITDDDAAPRPEWLARIAHHFASDTKIGGVGGRDWVHENGRIIEDERPLVGRVLWFGRIVGNHHKGFGPVREVDILKGANCSFRMAAIRGIGFDLRLRGSGAQVHNDMLVSLAVKRAGWRLLYDPQVAVDHYPGRRFDEDRRGREKFNGTATTNRAYNLRVAFAMISPGWKRSMARLWQEAVGTPDEPGLLNFIRSLARRDPNALARFRAARAAESRPR